MEQACSVNGLHDGPFALYLWVEKEYYEYSSVNKVRVRSYEHRSSLCEECARRVGAWKLPAKPEQVEEDDPNYHGEDEAPDDTSQPINYSGYGNPYEPYRK